MKSISHNNYIENFSVKDKLDDLEKVQYTGHSNPNSRKDGTPFKNENSEDYFVSLENHYDDVIKQSAIQEDHIFNQNILLMEKNKDLESKMKELKRIEEEVQTTDRSVRYDIDYARTQNKVLSFLRKIFLAVSIITLGLLYYKFKGD